MSLPIQTEVVIAHRRKRVVSSPLAGTRQPHYYIVRLGATEPKPMKTQLASERKLRLTLAAQTTGVIRRI